MATENSILSAKKLISNLLTGKDADSADTEVVTDALQNKDKSKGLTQVIEEGDEALIRVLKRGFGLDEFEQTAKAKLVEDEKAQEGGGILSALKGLPDMLKNGLAAVAPLMTAALAAAGPAIAVAIAAAAGAAIGNAISAHLSPEVKEAIGEGTARVAAAIGVGEAQEHVQAQDRSLRQQYAMDVKAAVAAGKPANSVKVPPQLQNEIFASQSVKSQAKYMADDIYGNTVGRLWSGGKKYRDNADQWESDTALKYANNVNGQGDVTKPDAAGGAVPNRYAHVGKDGDFESKGGRMQGVYAAMRKAGFSHAQSTALTAEVGRENNYQSKYLFGTHTDAANNATNIGMISWQGDRAKKLQEEMAAQGLLGKDGKMVQSQAALDAQARYIRQEMETNPRYAKTKDKFLRNADIGQEDAAKVLGTDYVKWAYGQDRLRSGAAFDWKAHDERRRGYATQIAGSTVQARPTRTNETIPEPVAPVNPAMYAQQGGGGDDNVFASRAETQSAGLNLDNMLDIPNDDILSAFLGGGSQ